MDKNMNKYSNTTDATYFLGTRQFSCQSKFRAYEGLLHAGFSKVSLFIAKFWGKPASANWKF